MKKSVLTKVVARYRRNWPGYVAQYRVFLIVTLLAALADMASTWYVLLHEGPQAEGHPAIRAFSMILGPIAGPLIGKACQFGVIVALTVYFRRHALYIFLPVIVLYTWAAWYNVWGWRLYYPRLPRLLKYIGG